MPAEARGSGRARSVLAIYAHPDDEVLCAAGTLALCRRRGHTVHLVCATRGELGPIADAALATRETLAAVREQELHASCRVLGIEHIHQLGLPDSGVSWAAPLRGTLEPLVRLIHELRPDVMLTFGPDGLYGHSDHGAVSELASEARRLPVARAVEATGFSEPRLFYSVITAEMFARLLADLSVDGHASGLWGLAPRDFRVPASAITASVDVSAVLPQKLAALRSHRTQLEPHGALAEITEAAAARFFGVEHFRCADGRSGDPLGG